MRKIKSSSGKNTAQSILEVTQKQAKNNIYISDSITQQEKENYIADMLVHTLYLNNVNNSECYNIIKLFKEKVLGNVQIY